MKLYNWCVNQQNTITKIACKQSKHPCWTFSKNIRRRRRRGHWQTFTSVIVMYTGNMSTDVWYLRRLRYVSVRTPNLSNTSTTEKPARSWLSWIKTANIPSRTEHHSSLRMCYMQHEEAFIPLLTNVNRLTTVGFIRPCTSSVPWKDCLSTSTEQVMYCSILSGCTFNLLCKHTDGNVQSCAVTLSLDRCVHNCDHSRRRSQAPRTMIAEPPHLYQAKEGHE